MQIAEYTIPSLIKIAEPQRLFAEGTKLSSVEIIESIRKSCELDEVCALSVIRQMVDRGEISEELGATVRPYYLQKNLSVFEKTQQQLIEAYFSKPATQREGRIKTILENESKTLENGNDNLNAINDQQLRGRKRKSKLNNNDDENNNTTSSKIKELNQ
jgi:hypothetical protein